MLDTPITYGLNSVTDVSLSIQKRPADFSATRFYFEVNIEQKVDEQKGIMVTFCDVNITEEGKDFQLVKFVMGCSFLITDFSTHIKKDENGVFDVPDILSKQLTMITISTARGCLYEKLRGTYLNKAYLPIIMVDEMQKVEK